MDIKKSCIILPGYQNSGANHWQTYWQSELPNAKRFAPSSWDRPEINDWFGAIETAIDDADESPILVAHSLSCLLVAYWAQNSEKNIAGVFLVAPPDPNAENFPKEIIGFDNNFDTLNFPAVLIISNNDPYASCQFYGELAKQLNVDLINVGNLGHINGAANVLDWEQGKRLFKDFVNSID